MVIEQVTLQNFRNFAKKEFTFTSTITILIGPNGAGKTNTLEAIYLLSTGHSLRASLEAEMIKDDQTLARVEGKISSNSAVRLDVIISNSEQLKGKRLLVNNVAKRLVDFAGNLKTVLFAPQDLNLVSGSPSLRRRFLDGVSSQVDREYRRSLISYEKGLRQRNKVLEKIREGEANRAQLAFWDRLLIQNGNYLSAAREKLTDFINLEEQLGDQEFSLVYDKSGISESRLEQYANEEIAAAVTLVGPHRDDITFKIRHPKSDTRNPTPDTRNLVTFGSRGEQRMAVLWLKLAELTFIEKESGEKPVLLLDDIFSELDHKHREVVTGIVGHQQTIITTADPHTIEGLKASADIFEL